MYCDKYLGVRLYPLYLPPPTTGDYRPLQIHHWKTPHNREGADAMRGRVANLHPRLLQLLEELETRMGFELDINSGYRDPEHNKDVGGVENSEHTYDPAEGADIFCQRSGTRYTMLKHIYDLGVTRVGVGKTFIHIGISVDHPQHVAWTYYP